MHVTIDEPRQHSPAVQVDHLCLRRSRGDNGLVGAHREHAFSADRHCLRDRELRIDGHDLAVVQDHVGTHRITSGLTAISAEEKRMAETIFVKMVVILLRERSYMPQPRRPRCRSFSAQFRWDNTALFHTIRLAAGSTSRLCHPAVHLSVICLLLGAPCRSRAAPRRTLFYRFVVRYGATESEAALQALPLS
jgi:hypothetical protein